MTEYKSPLKDALCKFKQLNIKIHKESDNPYFKSKYADLSVILTAIESEAAKLGLVVTSRVEMIKSEVGFERILITELQHKDSDECVSSAFPIFGAKPQEIGSSITYARRYNIQSLLNLAAEDDDGNAANEAKPVDSGVQAVFKTAKERTKLYNDIMAELDKTKDSDDLASVWISRKDDLAKLRASDQQIFIGLENRKNELKELFYKAEEEKDVESEARSNY